MLAPLMKDTKLSPALTGGAFSFREGLHKPPATNAYGNGRFDVENLAELPRIGNLTTQRCRLPDGSPRRAPRPYKGVASTAIGEAHEAHERKHPQRPLAPLATPRRILCL